MVWFPPGPRSSGFRLLDMPGNRLGATGDLFSGRERIPKPANKNKSVWLTDEGAKLSDREALRGYVAALARRNLGNQ